MAEDRRPPERHLRTARRSEGVGDPLRGCNVARPHPRRLAPGLPRS
nr:MAG TPA: hypothetical protein [Caudoviricetes sp.]